MVDTLVGNATSPQFFMKPRIINTTFVPSTALGFKWIARIVINCTFTSEINWQCCLKLLVLQHFSWQLKIPSTSNICSSSCDPPNMTLLFLYEISICSCMLVSPPAGISLKLAHAITSIDAWSSRIAFLDIGLLRAQSNTQVKRSCTFWFDLMSMFWGGFKVVHL